MNNHNANIRRRTAVRGWLLPTFVILLFAIAALPVNASSLLIVSKTADTNDGVCNADCSLREAVSAANNSAGDNLIQFSIPASDAGCTAGSCTIALGAELDISDTSGVLTIDGAGADITISGNDSIRILFMQPGTALTLQKIALVHGYSYLDGGAMYVSPGCDLTINSSEFSSNELDFDAGDYVSGGALFIDTGSVVTISDSSFEDNSASTFGAYGHSGAIENRGTLNVYESTFADNHSDGAGAIGNEGILNVYSSTFAGNRAYHRYLSWGGGAISSSGTLFVTGSTFSGNGSDGPPSRTILAGAGEIVNSTFSNTGGVIGDLDITNSTFYKSFLDAEDAVVTNSIFSTGFSDGFDNSGNCIDNWAGTIGSTGIDGGGNISDDDTCVFTKPSSRNETDPKISTTLADNGGPTLTHLIAPNSPALDTALESACPDIDQRGVSRPQGAGCDRGAVELEPDITCPNVVGNLIENYCFEDGPGPWRFFTDGQGSYMPTGTDPYQGQFAADVTLQEAGTNVQLYQKDISLKPNTPYELLFAAYSSTGHDLSVYVQQDVSPYTNYGLKDFRVNLQTGWGVYTTTFTSKGFSSPVDDARLRFWLAPFDANGDLYRIDWVVLREVNAANPPIPEDPPVYVPPPGICADNPDNLIRNPGFELGKGEWSFFTDGSGSFDVIADDPYECEKNAVVNIVQPGDNVQLFQKDVPLQPGEVYQLRLAARSSGGQNVKLFLHKHQPPYTNYGLNGVELDLAKEWRVFAIEFVAKVPVAVEDGRLRFWLAPYDATGAQFEFDNVVLLPKSATVLQTRALFAQSAEGPSTSVARTAAARTSADSVLLQGYFVDGDDAGRLAGAITSDTEESWCYGARPASATLLPANGKFSAVRIVGIGSPKKITITGITQDELVGPQPDAYGVGGSMARLRRELNAGGDGRVYHIAFTAQYRNRTCSHEVAVTVPPDRRTTATDSGAQHNSVVKSR